MPQNLGCECSGPQRLPTCSEANADPILWQAELNDTLSAGGWTSLRGECAANCWCAGDAVAQAYQSLTPQQQADDQTSVQFMNAVTGVGPYAGDAAGTFPPDDMSGTEDVNMTDIPSGSIANLASNSSFRPCENEQCEVSTACPGTNCECKVVGARFEPKTTTVEYIAACMLYVAGQLSTRNEDVPCPCNASYVAHSCCSSPSGLVWEGLEMKLGELVKVEL